MVGNALAFAGQVADAYLVSDRLAPSVAGMCGTNVAGPRPIPFVVGRRLLSDVADTQLNLAKLEYLAAYGCASMASAARLS